MTLPTVENCEATFAGYETDVGYVGEIDCGVTPDVNELDERDKYYDDDGTYRFYPFGFITNFNGKMSTNQTMFRGLGSRGIRCNRHGRYETTVSVTYNPIDTRRLYYVLGILDENGDPVYDTSELDEAVCLGNCLPPHSIVKKIASDCDGEPDQYYLYNMSKIKTFTVTVDNEGAIEWGEELLAQYEQISATRSFTSPLQTVDIGMMPIGICCTPFMFYEGDVWITRYTEEDVSAEIVNPSQTQIIVENSIMDFNRDGVIDGNAGGMEECFYDVRVKVNGSYVSVASVNQNDTRYVTLTTGVDPGDTVIVEYNYMEQFYVVKSYDFTLEWNTEAQWGIYRGLAIPYEIRGKTYEITGNVTTNFESIKQYTQHITDQYFHLFFEQGGVVVFELLYTKWDDQDTPVTEEDLIEESLPFTSSRLCVDSQIRLPSDGGEEEGGGTTPDEDMFPVVNGFE